MGVFGTGDTTSNQIQRNNQNALNQGGSAVSGDAVKGGQISAGGGVNIGPITGAKVTASPKTTGGKVAFSSRTGNTGRGAGAASTANTVDASIHTTVNVTTDSLDAIHALESVSHDSLLANEHIAHDALVSNQALASGAIAGAQANEFQFAHDALQLLAFQSVQNTALASQTEQAGQNFAALSDPNEVGLQIATPTLGGGYPPGYGGTKHNWLLIGGVALLAYFIIRQL